MIDKKYFKMLQALPLEQKILKTKLRIYEALNYFGKNNMYVSVSGGLDSTVLHHIVKEYERENNIEKGVIPRVFSNTGQEFPNVKNNALSIADEVIKPKMTPYQVWSEIGYPIGSKKISRMISDIQNPTDENFYSRRLYLKGIKKDGTKGSSYCKLAKRYLNIVDESQEVKIIASHKCCKILKKDPFHEYEKKTGRHGFIALMEEEGGTREQNALKTGCNAFSVGKSYPMLFWTRQDALRYVILKNISIPKEYGELHCKYRDYVFTKKVLLEK